MEFLTMPFSHSVTFEPVFISTLFLACLAIPSKATQSFAFDLVADGLCSASLRAAHCVC
jgi:hypothetical protein